MAVLAAVVAVASVAAQQHALAAAQEPDAQGRAAMLRASIILKIAPYLKVEGAPAAQAPADFRIAVVGNDAIAAAIVANLPGKKVDASPVAVTAIDPDHAATGKSASSYDLLYVAGSVSDALAKRIVEAHAARPVVLVCERPGFAAAGGTVQMFVHDNGIRFEVNTEALKKQGLRASPQLLKLSRKGPE